MFALPHCYWACGKAMPHDGSIWQSILHVGYKPKETNTHNPFQERDSSVLKLLLKGLTTFLVAKIRTKVSF